MNNFDFNKKELNECLMDLYFYVLSNGKSTGHLEDFGKRYVKLSEENKTIIKNEIKSNININKPKSK